MTADILNKRTEAFNPLDTNKNGNISVNEEMSSSRANATFKKNLISGILKTTGLVIGEIIPPTLSITQKHLLPDIFESLYEIYEDAIPNRTKDWLDVIIHSIESFFKNVIKTEKGETFINEINAFIDDFLDVITADKSRQLVVDFAAAITKSGNILKAPQTKELIDHLAVLMCRLVDVISTPSAKHLYHNMADLTWAVIEMLTDTRTLTSFAEVIANICYNLEMEKRLHRPMSRMNLSNEEKANQRKKRARFHRNIFLNKKEFNDNDVEKNESIKNVLDHAFQISSDDDERIRKRTNDETYSISSPNETQSLENMPPRDVAVKLNNSGESYDDVVSLPLSSSIMTESPSMYLNETQSYLEVMKEKRMLVGSETNDPKSAKFSLLDDKNTTNIATEELNKNNGLNSNNQNMDMEDMFCAHTDPSKTNLSEESLNRSVYEKVLKRMQEKYVCFEEEGGEKLERDKDDIDSCETDNNSLIDSNIHVDSIDLMKEDKSNAPVKGHLQSFQNRIPGSSATTQFYEALENKTNARRIATMQSILNSFEGNTHSADESDMVKEWFPSATAAAGAGNELGQDILEKYLSISRKANVNIKKNNLRNRVKKKHEFSIANFFFNRITIFVFIICFMCFVCISFFSLGVYGLFTFVNSKNSVTTDVPKQEITIRIIREVVVRTDSSDSSVLAHTAHDESSIIIEEDCLSTDFILQSAIEEGLKTSSCAKDEILTISSVSVNKKKGGIDAEISMNKSG